MYNSCSAETKRFLKLISSFMHISKPLSFVVSLTSLLELDT